MTVDWVSGACMVVRKKAIEDVGLMDERFFMYWEDVDWCKRMWYSGWKVVYFPQATIVHYVGGSSDKLIIRSVFEFHKSCYHFFEKYTKFPLSVVSPLVFWGIALRFFFVLFFHKMHWLSCGPKSRLIGEKSAFILLPSRYVKNYGQNYRQISRD